MCWNTDAKEDLRVHIQSYKVSGYTFRTKESKRKIQKNKVRKTGLTIDIKFFDPTIW